MLGGQGEGKVSLVGEPPPGGEGGGGPRWKTPTGRVGREGAGRKAPAGMAVGGGYSQWGDVRPGVLLRRGGRRRRFKRVDLTTRKRKFARP